MQHARPLMANINSNSAKSPSLHASFSTRPSDILAAQTLRYQIFGEEFGAHFDNGIDADAFDDICHHLLVHDTRSGQLVGYTRILTQDQVSTDFYSGNEFHLDELRNLPGRIMELGRTCIHPDYRNGATIGTLWMAVARFLLDHNFDFLIGCASISMADNGSLAHRLNRYLSSNHRSELITTQPRLALPPTQRTICDKEKPPIPALLAAYLRMGARICGDPCWDPDFNCADLFVLLQVKDLPKRYARRFLSAA